MPKAVIQGIRNRSEPLDTLFSVRLRPSLKAKLRRLAKEAKRTESATIRALVEWAWDARSEREPSEDDK